MQINWVAAQAFGPFAGAKLDFKPGLNVVVGPNESGKSTWHAAIYAALCGRRRRSGSEDRDQLFRELHKPWNGSAWQVGAEIKLAAGARIELQRELVNNVACTAKDVDLSIDVANDIVFDGSPDASVWLGLNRRTFLATAAVNQTDLLRGVLDSADKLQDSLQRVADSAGAADATAAAALDLIAKFAQEQVGTERKGAVKPLRRAQEARLAAEADVHRARELHSLYLSLVDEADRLRAVADAATLNAAGAAERLGHLAEVERLASLAESARLRSDRAATLAAEGALAISTLAERVERITELATAERVSSVGITTDTRLDPVVEELAKALEQSVARLAVLRGAEPVAPEEAETLNVALVAGPAQLRNIAAQLDQFTGPGPDGSDSSQQLADARRVLTSQQEATAAAHAAFTKATAAAQGAPTTSGSRRLALSIAAGLLIVAAVAIGAVGNVLAGVLLAVLASTFAVLAIRQDASASASASVGVATETMQAVSVDLVAARDAENAAARAVAELEGKGQARTQERVAWVARRDELIGWCNARRLPFEPSALRQLAADVELHEQRCTALASWGGEVQRLKDSIGTQTALLSTSLLSKGYTVSAEPSELAATYRTYVAECDLNSKAAIRTETELATISAGADVDSMATELARRKERQPSLIADEAQARKVVEYTLAECGMAMNAAALEPEAEGQRPDVAARLSTARTSASQSALEAAHASAAADSAAGAVRERASALPSVPEAEEQLAQSDAELQRVLQLRETLDRTTEFLTAAQQHLYRDVAPILTKTLAEWLPFVTSGRYVRASINPLDLRVEVATRLGVFRSAERLSVGTREQIYLLLRVALAEHLTKESCPLLLDDVTVHADDARKLGILQLVHRLTEDRQVILFAQERFVADWARANLDPKRDALIELSPSTSI